MICCATLACASALKCGASLQLRVPGCSEVAVLRALEVTFVVSSILGTLLVSKMTGASSILASGMLGLLLATLGSVRMVSGIERTGKRPYRHEGWGFGGKRKK